jgi:DNA-binding GntR family transcriptional regulator
LIDILHENPNVSFEYFTENLACGKADKYEAELLKIKRGDPIFFLTRKTFTKKDEIIEVARTFMPGERCEFYFKHGEQVRIDLK